VVSPSNRSTSAVTRVATARSAHRTAPSRSSEVVTLDLHATEGKETAECELGLLDGSGSKGDTSDDNDDVQRRTKLGGGHPCATQRDKEAQR
jgi:hypothetical protein